MRKVMAGLFMALTAANVAVLAADPPALPNYTKEPYWGVADRDGIFQEHPELGRLHIARHLTLKKEEESTRLYITNEIIVGSDDRSVPKYAIWTQIDRDKDTRTVRKYLYKGGKWVLEAK